LMSFFVRRDGFALGEPSGGSNHNYFLADKNGEYVKSLGDVGFDEAKAMEAADQLLGNPWYAGVSDDELEDRLDALLDNVTAHNVVERREEIRALRAEMRHRKHGGIVASADPLTLLARTFSDEERERLAGKGEALNDGSFPIANKEDLSNAIQAFGRAKNKKKAKKHIIKRAKALGAEDMIPEGWTS
jgi:hypothetical protein